MQLLDTKALLAKLMATENLVIEEKKVPTASFDVKSRVLTVPVLDEKLTGYQYDLFMGHEVGHALYTPLDGIYKAKDQKLPHSIRNVIEDSRIERKIKYNYPGLRLSFVKAYNDFYAKDFFGTKGVDLNTMNLIDRINLHCKVGPTLQIQFNDEEKVLLKAVETTETYDDVIDVAKRIVEYMKLKEEEKEVEIEIEESESGDGNGDEFDSDGYEESDDFDDEEDSSLGDSMENDEPDQEVDDQESSASHYDDGMQQKDNIRSFTDESYKQNEKQLFAQDPSELVYCNIPKVNLDEAIWDYKDLLKCHREFLVKQGLSVEYTTDLESFQKIRKESTKVVSYLVKEFEMRKNAEQLKRASTAKTGDLNLNKIFSYKFSEDIFKKITVVPNGKSHGLVMFIDWSGSMKNHLENTVKQLISLVMFCKKVNIPYEVFAFAEGSRYSNNESEKDMKSCYRQKPIEGDVMMNDFQLLNLLSSRMSAVDFTYAASLMVYIAKRPHYAPYFMCLGNTPLNEAIITAMEYIPEFQNRYKLQIVNTVFLTDGEGHPLRNYVAKNDEGHLVSRNTGRLYSNTKIVLRDTKTKRTETIVENNSKSHTSAYVKLLKARTGCNVIGFYILSGRDFNRYGYDFFPKAANFDEIKINFRKDKYAICLNSGFDEYYMLRSEGLDTEEVEEFVVKENATTRGLVSAFSKYAGGRVANRVVLNRFIGLIS